MSTSKIRVDEITNEAGNGPPNIFGLSFGFDSGTKMLFRQASAPVGWTKDTAYDDHAIRVVSGSPSDGGTSGFSTALGTPAVSGSVSLSGSLSVGNLQASVSGNVTVDGTTLSTAQIPSHRHSYGRAGNNVLRGQRGQNTSGTSGGNTSFVGGSGSHAHNVTQNLSGALSGEPGTGTLSGSLTSATADVNVKYVDFILATKD